MYIGISVIFLGIAMALAATSYTGVRIESVSAEANCESATPNLNSAGNWRGNVKQCIGESEAEGPKEPIRSCDSPNKFKDNDGDGNEGCKVRGN